MLILSIKNPSRAEIYKLDEILYEKILSMRFESINDEEKSG